MTLNAVQTSATFARASSDPLAFNRQFIGGPDVNGAPPEWKRMEGPGNMRLACHPGLPSTTAAGPSVKLLCLGDVFDPFAPDKPTDEIVRQLAADADSFQRLEEKCAALGGRWVMLASLGAQMRLYPDACGLRSVFYHRAPDTGDVWVASQPGLLAGELGIPRNELRARAFLQAPRNASWPGYITAYDDIYQLWPNHYLDLASGEQIRFWPNGPIPAQTLDAAVERMMTTLPAILLSASRRRHLSFALTGGYDSRLLFAVSRPLHREMDFYVVTSPGSAPHDLSIARRLARLAGVPLRVIRAKPCQPATAELFRRNVDDLYLDPARASIRSFESIPEGSFYVSGNIAEVGRCFYYRDGRVPENPTVDTLCRVSEHEGNVVAREVFAGWLSGVPRDIGSRLLDLFYWEHRLGAWLSSAFTGFDTFRDVLAPFNCRDLLVSMLGVGVEYRREPYQLFREVCRRTFPEVLEIPFNTSLSTRVSRRVRGLLPWRVTKMMDDARRWYAGFDQTLWE